MPLTIKDIENMLNPKTQITDITVLGNRIHIWLANGIHISILNFATPLAPSAKKVLQAVAV